MRRIFVVLTMLAFIPAAAVAICPEGELTFEEKCKIAKGKYISGDDWGCDCGDTTTVFDEQFCICISSVPVPRGGAQPGQPTPGQPVQQGKQEAKTAGQCKSDTPLQERCGIAGGKYIKNDAGSDECDCGSGNLFDQTTCKCESSGGGKNSGGKSGVSVDGGNAENDAEKEFLKDFEDLTSRFNAKMAELNKNGQ
ncbi:MAG: hypothetical protein LBL21_00590 [Rickettsiales bacterium]|jgi:hypothetical protein|nr:hypothetical protein [Rickettsiales bacterium]